MKIFCLDEALKHRAQDIAGKMGFEVCYNDNDLLNRPVSLLFENERLSLVGDNLRVTGDFSKLLPRLKPNNLNGEMIVKATRIKNADSQITVIDATAGMGEDSFLLAGAGFKVTMLEYNSVIASLLEDTLIRAEKDCNLKMVTDNMNFIYGDSIKYMNSGITADVVLLDPMFPQRQKSGLIKKKFQLLQKLECPCCDEAELLSSAKKCAKTKVIVKRPQKGPFLNNEKPSYSIDGNSIRYDVYVLK